MIPSQLQPKYKTLALIKTDVWNTLKTKKLKKKKWRILIANLKRKHLKKKSNILNYNAKTVSKFPTYYRYKYQRNLIMRAKIKLIYGSIQDYKIKHLAKRGNAQGFIQSLEQKTPIFLYRMGLTFTYSEAKIHYMHKRILVNGSYQKLYIKKGDIVHFSPNFEKLLKRRITTSLSKAKNYKLSSLKLFSYSNLDFDSCSFRFYFMDNIKYYKNHPFLIPFEKTWRYYTRV